MRHELTDEQWGNQKEGETEKRNSPYREDLCNGRMGRRAAVCSPNECLQGTTAPQAVSLHRRVSYPLWQVRLDLPLQSGWQNSVGMPFALCLALTRAGKQSAPLRHRGFPFCPRNQKKPQVSAIPALRATNPLCVGFGCM